MQMYKTKNRCYSFVLCSNATQQIGISPTRIYQLIICIRICMVSSAAVRSNVIRKVSFSKIGIARLSQS